MLQLVGGLFLLVIGAEFSVRAAVRLAASLKVRPLIIGLTVVAMGSSAPQMAVSVQAAFSSSPDISVGSVVGSNIFNVLVTLGLCALIIPLRVARQLVRVDIPLMIGASLLVFALSYNGELSAFDGAILLLALLAYLLILARRSRKQLPTNPPINLLTSRSQQFISLATMVFGLVLLVMGGRLMVDAAVIIAQDLGLSERVIGLTVIAGSTSLPALSTSLIAASRGERDIAVGNVIGSNLFNLLGVLGLTALIAPTPLSISPNALDFDLPVMLAVAALCLPVFYSGYRVTRSEGLLLLALYLAYGLHIVSFTTGMPLADKLERVMNYAVLPVLTGLIVFSTVRAWRRQH
ncbi:calcium/sodium antiporter [Pseudomonas sp.]|uniref:calcium/sodium antiporter n=1 Tax=Pseudomonas sp. TaxID=306 RepID=UPI00261A9DC1|nr:calcium/sodium antiporter [Pseudomonas sp.]